MVHPVRAVNLRQSGRTRERGLLSQGMAKTVPLVSPVTAGDYISRKINMPFQSHHAAYRAKLFKGAECAIWIKHRELPDMGDAARYGLTYLSHRSV